MTTAVTTVTSVSTVTAVNRFALLGSLLVAGVLVVIAGAAIAEQASTTFYACAKGDTIKGAISVDAQPSCASSQTLVSWNTQGPEGPEGPQGPQGDPGTSADVHTFDVIHNVGEEAIVAAAAGWELNAACNAGSMVVTLRHTVDNWKRFSLPVVPAGQFASINTVGIVNGFGEGTMGWINAYTDSGDVFLASEGNSIMAAVSNGASCLFAGALSLAGRRG